MHVDPVDLLQMQRWAASGLHGADQRRRSYRCAGAGRIGPGEHRLSAALDEERQTVLIEDDRRACFSSWEVADGAGWPWQRGAIRTRRVGRGEHEGRLGGIAPDLVDRRTNAEL